MQNTRGKNNQFFNFLSSSQKGFTLLEMVISTGLFAVLVVSAINITLSVSNAQIKAANMQAIQDNIRFSLELITKEMRTGGGFTLSTKCAPSGSEISFTTSQNQPRIYYLNTQALAIMRSTQNVTSSDCDNPAKFSALTSEEVSVERLFFFLQGAAVGPGDGQPFITIALRVKSKSPKYFLESSMNLQTTIVQRLRDL